jgi:hypothetical protein
MSNFLLEDYEAALKFVDAEAQKMKFKLWISWNDRNDT